VKRQPLEEKVIWVKEWECESRIINWSFP
jgi:hypothetical protein